MFPIKGFHFWYNEDVSISQYNKIAQNQRDLCKIVMNYDSSNCRFMCDPSAVSFKDTGSTVSSLFSPPISLSSELVRTEQIFNKKHQQTT